MRLIVAWGSPIHIANMGPISRPSLHHLLLLSVLASSLCSSDAIEAHFRYDNVGASGQYSRVSQMIPNSGTWNVCPTDNCFKSPVLQY